MTRIAALCLLLTSVLVLTSVAGAEETEDVASQAYGLRLEGKAAAARAMLEKAVAGEAETSAEAAVWYELARTRFYLRDLDAAKEAALRAVALRPEDADYGYLLAMTEVYRGIELGHDPKRRDEMPAAFSDAKKALARVLALDPAHREARLRLVEMLARLPEEMGGNAEEAAAEAKTLAALDPVYGLEAQCAGMSRDEGKATVSQWEAVVAAHAESARAKVNLAKALMLAGRMEEAGKTLQTAVEADRSEARNLFHLAAYYAGEKKLALAEAAVRGYLALEPAPPRPLRAYAWFALATLAHQAGHTDKANSLRNAARAMDPAFWPTRQPPPDLLFDE